jgi:transposase
VGVTYGVDCAEDHHDVVVMDDLGMVLRGRRIDADVDRYADLLALIADHGGSAGDTLVALETDKNLVVRALRAAGFTVYPINPRAVARTANATIRLARSPTMATPPFWPTSCAPTTTSTGLCPPPAIMR